MECLNVWKKFLEIWLNSILTEIWLNSILTVFSKLYLALQERNILVTKLIVYIDE